MTPTPRALPVPTEAERTVYYPYRPDPDPVRTEFHLTDDKTVVVNRVQELGKIRDRIRSVKNEGRSRESETFRLTHMVPNIWYERWCAEDGSPGRPFNAFRLRGRAFAAWVEKHIAKDDCTDFRIDGKKDFHAYVAPQKQGRKRDLIRVNAETAQKMAGKIRRVPARLSALNG